MVELVTTWGAGSAWRLNRDEIAVRLGGCKNFVGKWKEFIFNAFVNLESVQRSDGCDKRRFRSQILTRSLSMSLWSSLFHWSTILSENKYFRTSILRCLTIFHEWPPLLTVNCEDSKVYQMKLQRNHSSFWTPPTDQLDYVFLPKTNFQELSTDNRIPEISSRVTFLWTDVELFSIILFVFIVVWRPCTWAIVVWGFVEVQH